MDENGMERLPGEPGDLAPIQPPIFPSQKSNAATWKTALVLVGSALLSLVGTSFSNYLQTRGFVSVEVARIFLAITWVAGVTLIVIAVMAFGLKRRVSTIVTSVLILTGTLLGLEFWATRSSKPKVETSATATTSPKPDVAPAPEPQPQSLDAPSTASSSVVPKSPRNSSYARHRRFQDALRFDAALWEAAYTPGTKVFGLEWKDYFTDLEFSASNGVEVPLINIDLTISTDIFIYRIVSEHDSPDVRILTNPSTRIRLGDKASDYPFEAIRYYQVTCTRLLPHNGMSLLIIPVNLSQRSRHNPEYVAVSGTYETEPVDGGQRYQIQWKHMF
jgi:hypothetical protein